MDRSEVAKHAGIIPEKDVYAFLEYLVRSPELPGLLSDPHQTEERLQGDLIREFTWVYVDDSGSPKITNFTVTVINNTCDLQPNRSKLVNVAAVYDFQKYQANIIKVKGEKSAADYLASLKQNKISELVYIQECPGYPEGIVIDLNRISSSSSKIYEQALSEKRRIASFTQKGFYVFLLKMTNFLARAEANDVTRNVGT